MSNSVLVSIQKATTARVTPVVGAVLQRQCDCGNHTVAGGECAGCAKKKSGLQRKLTIGASNDPLEQEADRVADQVLAAPVHPAVSGASPNIQRFVGQPTGQADAVPGSVDRVLASPGRPLEPALQQDMGQRLGHDFSRVRVHSGAAAEQSAREVNANAYTVGHNVVFGAGRYSPGTHEGRRLIAHELTHVVQQSGAGGMGSAKGQGGPRILAASPRDDSEPLVSGAAPSTLQETPPDTARETAPNTIAGLGPETVPAGPSSLGAEQAAVGPECSRKRKRGQDLPLARTVFDGERGFATIPSDGHPGPGGLRVTGSGVEIKIGASWVEQIPDESQRPPDQRGRKADTPKYYLSFNGWQDDCEVGGAGSPASSVQSGNLAIGTEHTVKLQNLLPGRYGLAIAPSTAAPERNRVLRGHCEVT